MSIQKPILLDLPMPITTKRLTIRPMMPGDGKQIFEAIEESRSELCKWFPWVNNVKHWKDSEKTAREFYANFILRKSFSFLIFCEKKFIGGCGFNDPDWSVPSASIGYWCQTSEQGKGYIREATAALILYAFQVIGFKRLTILCKEENTKSISIAETLGFFLETKAKGLLSNPNTPDLSVSRCYVRFDEKDLEKWPTYW